MKPLSVFPICGALICAPAIPCPAQDAMLTLEPLWVSGRGLSPAWSQTEEVTASASLRHADAAATLRSLPGAAIMRNGPQTGIVQLRGLSGDRVGVRVDGMSITPACPNHMDPPLHYADAGAGDLIEMFAGVAPVSAGGNSLGGAVRVDRAAPRFAEDDGWRPSGRIGGSFRGDQDAWLLASDLGMANRDAAFEYRGSAATADDLRFPGGTVGDSGFDLTRHSVRGAWRRPGGYIALDSGYAATRDAGTPALPMDMIEDDAWKLGVTHQERFEWGAMENRIYLHDIDHLMDNFTLRPVAPGAMAMEAPSSSRDYGWRSDFTLPRGESTWRTGVDLHRNEFDAEQVAVATGWRRDTFADNRRSRAGAYLDWERGWNKAWTTRIGLRTDVVASDAGSVANAILPPLDPARSMILADQAAFNAADRSFTDLLVDGVASVRFEPDDHSAIDFALAVKNRAPSLVERYLWTPLNASAGLADGRTYLGNLDLDPETMMQAAVGLGRSGGNWNVKLTPFYQSINNYIQGMPILRPDANGQPVLQYRNIDRAELYGFELAGGWDLTREWSLDASVSHVRGRNADDGEDLYRIAPLRGLVDLAWRDGPWESHLECEWADAQDHVSDVQGEAPTPGHAILHLRFARKFGEGLRVELGVENLLDKRYADHLGGVNRAGGGDLAVGERIPSAGRFAYTAVSFEF